MDARVSVSLISASYTRSGLVQIPVYSTNTVRVAGLYLKRQDGSYVVTDVKVRPDIDLIAGDNITSFIAGLKGARVNAIEVNEIKDAILLEIPYGSNNKLVHYTLAFKGISMDLGANLELALATIKYGARAGYIINIAEVGSLIYIKHMVKTFTPTYETDEEITALYSLIDAISYVGLYRVETGTYTVIPLSSVPMIAAWKPIYMYIEELLKSSTVQSIPERLAQYIQDMLSGSQQAASSSKDVSVRV